MAQDLRQRKLLGIDLGEKRIGLALWSPEAKLASPLPVLYRKSKKQVIEALSRLIAGQGVEALVLGVPYGLEGQITKMTENMLYWSQELQKSLSLPLYEVDESLTTQEALRRLDHTSSKKKKTLKDSVSAVIILEEFIRQYEASLN